MADVPVTGTNAARSVRCRCLGGFQRSHPSSLRCVGDGDHLRAPRGCAGGAAVAAPGPGPDPRLQAGVLAVALRGGPDHPVETQVPARRVLRPGFGQERLRLEGLLHAVLPEEKLNQKSPC